MLAFGLALLGFAFAAIPAATFARNLHWFRPLPSDVGRTSPSISVLIPARNEAESIRDAVETVLANVGVNLEVIVLDDHSSDATAAIVAEIAHRDSRVRVAPAPPLPEGWCGKQHACNVLAGLASNDLLVWMDADVRMARDALARMATEMGCRPTIGLLSGFPREETGTWLERLLIPLIHFILLGFLPIGVMRRLNRPALAAGCGQLFMARRSAYEEAGGHSAIRSSLHDGISLPRAFRKAGRRTDLFDATDLARCRMYRNAGEVWRGLLKNAGEGMATPGGIIPWTILLAGGQVLPPVLALSLATASLPGLGGYIGLGLAAATSAMNLAVRSVAAAKFRQPWSSALLHPVGVALLLAIQWQSLLYRLIGRAPTWKGRAY